MHGFNPRPACGAKVNLYYLSRRSAQSTVSIRAPRAGRKRRHVHGGPNWRCGVSIRAPRAGRKRHFRSRSNVPRLFQSAPACGAKDACITDCCSTGLFQSAPRVRGESRDLQTLNGVKQFQSAPRVRGESPVYSVGQFSYRVSIRAPRAGRKIAGILRKAVAAIRVSIRAPRAGRKPAPTELFTDCTFAFQSAPRVRGERPCMFALLRKHCNSCVSIRAPRAGRKVIAFGSFQPSQLTADVSIRAPRAGRKRMVELDGRHRLRMFQSAPRVRGESSRFARVVWFIFKIDVSIRAPRAGRKTDARVQTELNHANKCFNPRPACGAKVDLRKPAIGQLYSTVSIRAPRAGRKTEWMGKPNHQARTTVSIRAPRAGRKNADIYTTEDGIVFQSAPRVRGESMSF